MPQCESVKKGFADGAAGATKRRIPYTPPPPPPFSGPGPGAPSGYPAGAPGRASRFGFGTVISAGFLGKQVQGGEGLLRRSC